MSRKKCTSIGGQAVIEGVMMRGTQSIATAVRDEKGKIVVESNYLKPTAKKNFLFRTPIIRGFISFFSSMATGMGCLMRSGEVFGEEEEPSKFEKWLAKKTGASVYNIIMAFSVLLGVALSVALFFFLPHLIVSLFEKIPGVDTSIWWINLLMSLLEGVVRIGIFVGYIALTTLMPDVKRTYMYHGAEHKTISCYENDLELTVENARKMTTKHDRCGTAFMFIVMVISILVFAVVSSLLKTTGAVQNNALLFLIKLACIPLISGISYECLKVMAKYDNVIVRILKAPGLALQKLTTKEPTDDMLEVAIVAFKTVQAMDQDNTIPVLRFDTTKIYKKCREEIDEILNNAKVDKADGDWIMCQALGIKRSQLEAQTHIKESQFSKAKEWAKKRAEGMPIWKIFGETNFYGYDIKVTLDTLSPRPETEEVCEELLKHIDNTSKVLDMCTGSGCIAITIAKEKGASVVAVDKSKKALEVAKENIELNNVQEKVILLESDMFEKVEGEFDAIVSNPPYIPTKDIDSLDVSVKEYDPIMALDGGLDGLDFYRIIAKNSVNHLKTNGYLILEIGINQAEDVKKLLEDNFDVEIKKDLSNIDRIVIARKK